MNKIEIPLSKIKILPVLIGAFGFVFFGILFIIDPDKFISPLIKDTEIIRLVGVISVLFFGAGGIYGTKKMFDKSVGLTVDDDGVIDNTNAVSVGRIKWSDITEIKSKHIMSAKYLLIFIKDPNEVLEKVKGIKRKLMTVNMKTYGTPLSITSTTLKYNFNDLEKLLQARLHDYRERMTNS